MPTPPPMISPPVPAVIPPPVPPLPQGISTEDTSSAPEGTLIFKKKTLFCSH